MTETVAKETLGFQAEVKQLLHLMIHSLYSHKEIFLRELISNASDAADKLRFEALSDPALFENDAELKIHVSVDKEAKSITVRDNGIGMSRQEVIEHIGTIAKSGTREFFGKLSGDQQKDAQLIGHQGHGQGLKELRPLVEVVALGLDHDIDHAQARAGALRRLPDQPRTGVPARATARRQPAELPDERR